MHWSLQASGDLDAAPMSGTPAKTGVALLGVGLRHTSQEDRWTSRGPHKWLLIFYCIERKRQKERSPRKGATSKIVKKCQKHLRHFSTTSAQGKKRQKSSNSVKKNFGTFRQFSRGSRFPAPFGRSDCNAEKLVTFLAGPEACISGCWFSSASSGKSTRGQRKGATSKNVKNRQTVSQGLPSIWAAENFLYQNSSQSRFSGVYPVFEVFQERDLRVSCWGVSDKSGAFLFCQRARKPWGANCELKHWNFEAENA